MPQDQTVHGSCRYIYDLTNQAMSSHKSTVGAIIYAFRKVFGAHFVIYLSYKVGCAARSYSQELL